MDKIWFKNYPPNVPHELPPIEQDICSLFLDTCEKYKNQTAFISFNHKITYQEVKNLSFQMAHYLQSQGLQKGDKIIVQLPNILQHPISFWGAVLSGLTVINMNPLYTQREMLYQIKNSEASAIITLSSSAKSLEVILPQTQIKTIIISDLGDLLPFPTKQLVNGVFKYIKRKVPSYSIPQSIKFLQALNSQSKTGFKPVQRELEDLLLIQYTGGTTGISKGVCLTQKNVLSNLAQCFFWTAPYMNQGEEKAVAPLPLYHIFALLVNELLFFTYGASNLLIADPRKISYFISQIKKHPVTIGTGLNTLFKALMANPKFKTIDFSPWKFFISGGMTLEPSTQKEWEQLTSSYLVEGYGLTEASPVVSSNYPQSGKMNSIGLPFPSTDVRITNDKGESVGIDQDGELEAKGPQVMKGYYQNKEEDKKIFTSDGWLKTGDIASMDKEGFLYIRDRKKDMINVSGFNVYPSQIENILALHPKIQETAVVGVPDEHSLEAVKAFIVKKDPNLTEQEVIDHCKKQLVVYRVPKIIEFVKTIPKTNIGKPLRRSLKEKHKG